MGMSTVDDLENQYTAMILDWFAATGDILRRVKPATPSTHLMSLIVLFDPDERGILLGLHRHAGAAVRKARLDVAEPKPERRRQPREDDGLSVDVLVSRASNYRTASAEASRTS